MVLYDMTFDMDSNKQALTTATIKLPLLGGLVEKMLMIKAVMTSTY